nr:hypothetical protein [Vibrio neptunius]
MQYFESLVDQLTKRAARATLGQFGLRSKPLREFLWQSFSQSPGKEGLFSLTQYLKQPLVGNYTLKVCKNCREYCSIAQLLMPWQIHRKS